MRLFAIGLLAAAPVFAVPRAHAEIAVSANDGHTVFSDGSAVAAKSPTPDTLTVIDLGKTPPRLASTIDVPSGVGGTPFGVAVSADESWAIVTSATALDSQVQGGIGSNNRLSVVDLRASPPRVVQSLEAGPGAAAVRLSPDGRLALVANRDDGSISIFAVADKRLTPVGKVDLGDRGATPDGLAFTRDGQQALVSRAGDDTVGILDVAGDKVTAEGRRITTGIRPGALDINAAGTLAAVANAGRDGGDIDTIALIDLTKEPYRTVEIVGVPSGPQAVKFSLDGRFLAVTCDDGSDAPAASPFHHDKGVLWMFAVQGDTGHGIGANSRRLRRVAEAPVGARPSGIAFSKDGRTVLVQEMMDRQIGVFHWLGGRLDALPALPVSGAPQALRTGWP